jgi:two-component system response regulator FixJ
MMNKTVYLVDDSEQWLETIKERLDVEDIQSETYLSAVALIERLSDVDTATLRGCILLDMLMPDMDGEQAFRQLTRMGVHIPIAIVSSYVDGKRTAMLRQAGIADCISKTDRRLFERINDLLESDAANPPA